MIHGRLLLGCKLGSDQLQLGLDLEVDLNVYSLLFTLFFLLFALRELHLSFIV